MLKDKNIFVSNNMVKLGHWYGGMYISLTPIHLVERTAQKHDLKAPKYPSLCLRILHEERYAYIYIKVKYRYTELLLPAV